MVSASLSREDEGMLRTGCDRGFGRCLGVRV